MTKQGIVTCCTDRTTLEKLNIVLIYFASYLIYQRKKGQKMKGKAKPRKPQQRTTQRFLAMDASLLVQNYLIDQLPPRIPFDTWSLGRKTKPRLR